MSSPKVEPVEITSKQIKPEEKEESVPQPFSFYLKPDNAFTIIAHKWGLFTGISAVIYTYHLYWTIYGVDQFCDATRNHVCGATAKEEYATWLNGLSPEDKLVYTTDATAAGAFGEGKYYNAPAAAADASSAVLDTWIAMVTIFHMIEWLR